MYTHLFLSIPLLIILELLETPLMMLLEGLLVVHLLLASLWVLLLV